MSKSRFNYQRLAYTVLRDAVGFYFGIPEFFEQNSDRQESIQAIIDTGKTEEEAEKILVKRTKELQDDFSHCCILLKTDNIWYQLLDLNPEFFYNYLQGLSKEEKASLAVVPKWITQDYSLGRPYISDKFLLDATGNNSSTQGI